MGDEALYQLVRRCSRLQLVNLHGCRNVQVSNSSEYKYFLVLINNAKY